MVRQAKPKTLNPLLVKMGEQLREARKECGLTLEDVVRRTGISLKHLSNSENGHHDLRYSTLVKLLDFYEMELFIDKK